MSDNTNSMPMIIPQAAPETMKIVSEETSLGYMIINVADFDKATMKKYVEKSAEKPAS